MKPKIKAVLFDVDGTLIVAETALYYLFLAAIVKFGYKKQKKNKILKYMGAATTPWLRRLIPGLSEKRAMKMRHWIADKYAKYYLGRFARPIKHSTEVLRVLKKKRIKLALVTNQAKPVTEAVMKLLRFSKFDIVVNFDGSSKLKPKPHPDSINYALKKLKLKSSEAIFIGDTWADVEAGKAAHIKTYLVKHHYNKSIHAHKLDSLKEILELVR